MPRRPFLIFLLDWLLPALLGILPAGLYLLGFLVADSPVGHKLGDGVTIGCGMLFLGFLTFVGPAAAGCLLSRFTTGRHRFLRAALATGPIYLSPFVILVPEAGTGLYVLLSNSASWPMAPSSAAGI